VDQPINFIFERDDAFHEAPDHLFIHGRHTCLPLGQPPRH